MIPIRFFCRGWAQLGDTADLMKAFLLSWCFADNSSTSLKFQMPSKQRSAGVLQGRERVLDTRVSAWRMLVSVGHGMQGQRRLARGARRAWSMGWHLSWSPSG